MKSMIGATAEAKSRGTGAKSDDGAGKKDVAESKAAAHHGGSAEVSLRADSKDGGGAPLTALQEKHRAVEIEEEREVEEEFNALMLKPQGGETCVAKDPEARRKALGFKIISMNMRDAASGHVMWQQDQFDEKLMFTTEMEERIPKSILECKKLSREIIFHSAEPLTELRLEQRVFYCGSCIEQWFFAFGYVIPGSTNSWQQVIEAAPADQMLPAESLSGNLTFETAFYDGQTLMGKNLVRIFYV